MCLYFAELETFGQFIELHQLERGIMPFPKSVFYLLTTVFRFRGFDHFNPVLFSP